MESYRHHPLGNSRGITLVWTALLITLFVSFLSLVIDLGYGYVTKNELQNIADGAALAGARVIGKIYEPLTYTQQQAYTLSASDRTIVNTAVTTVGSANTAGHVSISIPTGDIGIGTWNVTTKTFTATTVLPTAVQVRARRDSTANNPLTPFFASIFGVLAMPVSATATAALTPISIVPPGELDLPVGISSQWFTNGGSCGSAIQFSPTGTLSGCAGWTDWANANPNANGVKTLLANLLNGTAVPPAVTAGQTSFGFTGGDMGSIFNNLINLYNAKKDASGNWKTFVMVYQQDSCSNPNGVMPIVGFATVIITSIQGPPDKTINGTVQCDLVEPGRGGGAPYGTLGSLPGLVQ